MKRLPLKLLISTLFISTTFPAFAEVGGSSNGIGQQAQATPATRTILVKMDDINYSQKTIDVKPGETVATMAARMMGTERKLDMFRMINAMGATATIQPGQRVKIISE